MTDISVTTSTYQPADRPWLLWEPDGTIGSVARIDGTLNFALFTANTHYPTGSPPTTGSTRPASPTCPSSRSGPDGP
jgi:hypothetical protein